MSKLGEYKELGELAVAGGLIYVLMKGVKVQALGQTIVSIGPGSGTTGKTYEATLTPGSAEPVVPSYYTDTSKAAPLSDYWKIVWYRLTHPFWYAGGSS